MFSHCSQNLRQECGILIVEEVESEAEIFSKRVQLSGAKVFILFVNLVAILVSY